MDAVRAQADQIRAYEVRLARMEARPDAHAYQREALIAQIALARRSADGVDYLARMRAGGTVTQVAIAPWLDRQVAQARVHAAIGDGERAAAHEAAARGVHAAGDARAVARMIAWERRLRARAGERDAAGLALGGIAMAVIDARAGREREEKWRYVAAQLGIVGRGGWRAAYEQAWLRARLPFDRERWEIVAGWIEAETVPVRGPEAEPALDTGAELDAAAEPDAGPGHAPGPEIGLREGYRRQLEWADEPRRRVLERIVAIGGDDQALLRTIEEEDLELALARATPLAQVEAGIARAEARGQRHVALHLTARRAALARAATVTELEAELAWGDACFAIEVTWWSVLVHLAASGAAAAADAERGDRRGLAGAKATIETLVGVGAAEALEMPWMKGIVVGVLWPIGDVVDLPIEAMIASYGDAGYPAVGPLRAAAAAAIAREAAAGIADPAAFMARLKRPRSDAAAFVARLARLLGGGTGDPARRVVPLWGTAVDLAALHEVDLIALRPRP